MAAGWKTVRVFISSTFRDMHRERDHLVRVVFPELKERCRTRHVHLIDVDLRWGVTEADAEHGKALDICLDEIDGCRPYFLGILGHRYGFVPEGHRHSITAQEIYHGVLHGSLPKQVVDLWRLLEERVEGHPLTTVEKDCLIRCYAWDADRRKYLLQEDVTLEEADMIRAVFERHAIYEKDRSFFFFRSEALSRQLVGTQTRDYLEEDQEDREKLESLKDEIVGAGLPHFDYADIDAFGQLVLDTLWKRIDAEARQLPASAKDWLEQEAELHELFMADRTRRFVGRRDLLNGMHGYCDLRYERSVLVITGTPGCGKSALMARFTEEALCRHPDWLILGHFVGASPASTSLRHMLRRFCAQLARSAGASEDAVEDIKELARRFPELLATVSEQRPLLIIIDGVNQLEQADHAHSMHWLPQVIPDNVRVVISTLAGEAHDALLRRRITAREETVAGLGAVEIRELAGRYLREIRHEFPNPEVEGDFYRKVGQGNPLYILVALEELRVFGRFEELGSRISGLPDSVPALFEQVLERIECDFSPALVGDCLSYIACGRHGMTAEELQTMLKTHAPPIDMHGEARKLPDMLWSRLYRSLGSYLFERSGVIDFFHGQLKDAVGKRYLREGRRRETVHQAIADYLDRRWRESYVRALDELPHQQLKASNWQALVEVLCDLQFIELKCQAGMTYDLVRDYDTSLAAMPEGQEERDRQRELDERVSRYTEASIAYARRRNYVNAFRDQRAPRPALQRETPPLPRAPSSVRPRTDVEIRADIRRITLAPAPLHRLRAFGQFVNAESHILATYTSDQSLCLQQAHNSADSGPVAQAARTAIQAERGEGLLLRLDGHLPPYNPRPACVRTLERHRDLVNGSAISAGGRWAISGGADKTVGVWDVETGECRAMLHGHSKAVQSVAITPDGRLGLSGSSDTTLRVWDLETGECVRALCGHDKAVTSIAVTPDGRVGLSGSADRTLRLWSLETGECLATLHGHADAVTAVALSPHDCRAVSGSRDATLRAWDLATAQCVGILETDPCGSNALTITPLGTKVVWGCSDGTIRTWIPGASSGVSVIDTHRGGVRALAMTADGLRAISGHSDNTAGIWDLDTGRCLKTFRGHDGWITAVSITPEGRRALSASVDKTLRLWDVETGLSSEATHAVGAWAQALAATEDGLRALSWHTDSTFRLWNLDSGQRIGAFPSHGGRVHCLVITPEGRRAVAGCSDAALRLWHIDSGRCLAAFEGHSDWVTAAAVTPSGHRIVSGSADATLRVWDLEKNSCRHVLRGHNKLITALAVSPSGRHVVSACEANTLRLWDIETGICLRMLERGQSSSGDLTITPDGRYAMFMASDGALCTWSLEDGAHSLRGGRERGVFAKLLTGGQRALCAGADRVLRLWDVPTGTCLGMFVFERGDITSGVLARDRAIVGLSGGELELLRYHGATGGGSAYGALRTREPAAR